MTALKPKHLKFLTLGMVKTSGRNSGNVVAAVVLLTAVSCALCLLILPELLRVCNLKIVKANNGLLQNASPDGLFSLGALPWIQHLQVQDDVPYVVDQVSSVLQHTRRPEVVKDTENASLEAEALASLRLALEMRQNGKEEKALRLFEHAFALYPSHPDILNHYGEFLEEHSKDVLKAEQFYSRALILSPGHSKAMVNRQRTLPIVEELDESRLNAIDIKRNHLINIPESNSALRRVKREAYFLHIYHTVALEGNTMTLSETRQIVETRLAVGGKSLMENNEVLGLDAALVFVNTSLVQKLGMLSLDDILAIHQRVMGFVDPLDAGKFRRTQVFVGDHVPPPPSEVPLLMQEFVEWLNSEEAMRLHPVRFAALAHYKLVYIHPFTDGNGRTSRLLMNLILMRAGFPPVIIRKQDRLSYYKYLEMANEGDVRPFIRFIADCTEKTLDVYLFATQEHPIPALENQRNYIKPTIIV